MKAYIGFAFCSLSLAAFALQGPSVGDVTMTQSRSRRVTIAYTLSGAPAIVTVDVQTNRGDGTFVSLGREALRGVSGDVSVVVQPGSRSIAWHPRKEWPSHPDDIKRPNARAVVTAWATNAPPDYVVVNLANKDEPLKYYASTNFLPYDIHDDYYLTNSLVMRKIPAAGVQWRMGSSLDRTILLTEDFYIAVFEMTKGLCDAAGVAAGQGAGFTPWNFAFRPVFWEKFTYLRGTNTDMSISASSRLATLRTKYALPFDIPARAQWEFACRAGCEAEHYDGTSGSTRAVLDPLCRYTYNSGHNGGEGGNGQDLAQEATFDKFTARPGSYKPNAFGLYDMYGNVSEWVRDYAYSPAASQEALVDPVSDEVGKTKVAYDANCRYAMGGSWNSWGTHITSWYSYGVPESNTDKIYTSNPFGIGYRLMMPIPGK